MGTCLSIASTVIQSNPGNLIDNPDGTTDEEFNKRFMEDHVLGKGEFGVVRMVHDMQGYNDENGATFNSDSNREPLACKYLKKGVVFKDNTLFAPIKPEVLQGEVTILKTLAGTDYCLKLMALYETAKQIYVVTELCAGGDMMEWASGQKQDLRTEDVSRIAYQFLCAVHHCASHKVIHRDIKPENIMFKTPTIQSPLRLIDFGSGTISPPSGKDEDHPNHHTTFAGSAFYISPEMFQRTYTEKTDVWSLGVSLYVLVAGYPSEQLQKAFNILQTSKGRNLRDLPNLPPNMPDSFYDLLEGLLVYRHKRRKSSGDLLHHEFVQFHINYFSQDTTTKMTTTTTTTVATGSATTATTLTHSSNLLLDDDVGISLEQIAAVAAGGSNAASNTATLTNNNTNNSSNRLIPSVSLSGSVKRHANFLGYVRYERSLTTLLATILTKAELEQFMKLVQERINQQKQSQHPKAPSSTGSLGDSDDQDLSGTLSAPPNEEKLQVIPIYTIKEILEKEISNDQIIPMMKQLKDSDKYNVFAYHINLLQDFVVIGKRRSSTGGRRRPNSPNLSQDTAKRQKLLDLTNPRTRGISTRLFNEHSNSSIASGGSTRSSSRFIPFNRIRSSGNLMFHANNNSNEIGSSAGATPNPAFLIPPKAVTATTFA